MADADDCGCVGMCRAAAKADFAKPANCKRMAMGTIEPTGGKEGHYVRVTRDHPPRAVTELWAWICTEENGGEGVAACEMEIEGQRMMMPLIGADEERIRSLEPYAKIVAGRTGRPVTLRQFMGVA